MHACAIISCPSLLFGHFNATQIVRDLVQAVAEGVKALFEVVRDARIVLLQLTLGLLLRELVPLTRIWLHTAIHHHALLLALIIESKVVGVGVVLVLLRVHVLWHLVCVLLSIRASSSSNIVGIVLDLAPKLVKLCCVVVVQVHLRI